MTTLEFCTLFVFCKNYLITDLLLICTLLVSCKNYLITDLLNVKLKCDDLSDAVILCVFC